MFRVLKITSFLIIRFLASSSPSPPSFCLIHFFLFLLLLPNIFDSSAVPLYSMSSILNALFKFISSSPQSHLTSLTSPFADVKLCDPPPGCWRVQHCSVAQKPREEPQHGCSATWSRVGLPGNDGRRKQQLRQRCARRQLPPTGCFHRDPSPSAGHHGRLLEAGLWLRLHRRGHAEPTQPVKLRLGKVKMLYSVLLLLICCHYEKKKKDITECFIQTGSVHCTSFYFQSGGYLNFTWDFPWHTPPSLFLYLTVLRISSFMPFCWALIPDHIDLKAWLDNTSPSFSFPSSTYISGE